VRPFRRRGRGVLGARSIALAIGITTSAAAGATEDFQLWTEVALEAPVGPRVRVGLRSELRFFEDASRFGLHSYDVGAAWLWSERVAFAFHFLEEFERVGGHFLAESRPYFDATVRGTRRGVELSNRMRVELRLLENRDDLVRVRDRLQLVLPWSLGPGGPRPFVSEELLFQTEGRGLDQNRAMVGLVVRRRALTFTAYGMLLSQDREDTWIHTPVAGLALTWCPGGPPMMSGDP
jgi:hypothetical protein